MEDKSEKMYRDYLKEKLDLVFQRHSYSASYQNSHREIVPKENYQLKRKLNGSYILIDPDGKQVGNKKYDFDEVWEFKDGIAKVRKGEVYNFIDIEGNMVGKTWFAYVWDFHDGWAHVNNGALHFYIDRNGNCLLDRKFNNVWNFHGGWARVQNFDLQYNYINTKGEFLLKQWQVVASDFSEGFATVSLGLRDSYIDTKGERILEYMQCHDYIGPFHEGFAVVRDRGKYNYIDYYDNILSLMSFKNANDFSCGVGLVETEDGFNYINKKGDLINNLSFDEADNFKYGLGIVKKGNRYNVINASGELLSEDGYDNECKVEIVSNSFYKVSKGRDIKYYPTNNFIKNNNVIDSRRGFGFKVGNNEYLVRYEPLMVYGSRYVLCRHKNGKNIIMYDKENDSYKDMGTVETLDFDSNFIFNYRNNTVYFMYRNQMIDITDYYCKYLQDKKEIFINRDTVILAKEEFFINDEELKKMAAKEKKAQEEEVLKQRSIEEEKELYKLKREEIIKEKERRAVLDNALVIIKEQMTLLDELEKQTGVRKRIIVSNFLIEVDDHKEINPYYIENDMLRHIDMKNISFKNVKVSGIDFRGCNIEHLIPTEVYNKDLSNCNFEGIRIDPLLVFSGVDIRGAKFSIDNNDLTPDIMPGFANAIYDRNTTYNGKSLVDILGECPNDPGSKKQM